MNFCPVCGMQLEDNSRFCPSCGTPVASQQTQQQAYQQQGYQQPYQQQGYQQPFQASAQPDVPSTGLKVLCFFFPIVGLILFIINQKDKPVSAKAYGKMALISFIIGIIFYIIYFAVFGVLMAKGVMDMDYSYYLFANLL